MTFLIDHFDLFGLRQVWLHLRSRQYTRVQFATPAPYRVVRHPLYAAVFLSQFGLILEYPSLFNAGVLVLAAVFKWFMIVNEERVLRRDPDYVAYTERVRWRVIPGVV